MAAPTLRALVRDIILSLFPWLVHAGVHTYRVARVNDDGTLDLEAAAGLLAPEPLPSVRQWAGAGTDAMLNVGDELLVVFRDNDRRCPVIMSFQPLRQGKLPAFIRIDVDGGGLGKVTVGDPNGVPKLVVRHGDIVNGAWYTAANGAGPVTFTPVPPATPGAIHITGPVEATSTKLQAE